jgi:hypothetical protein
MLRRWVYYAAATPGSIITAADIDAAICCFGSDIACEFDTLARGNNSERNPRACVVPVLKSASMTDRNALRSSKQDRAMSRFPGRHMLPSGAVRDEFPAGAPIARIRFRGAFRSASYRTPEGSLFHVDQYFAWTTRVWALSNLSKATASIEPDVLFHALIGV